MNAIITVFIAFHIFMIQSRANVEMISLSNPVMSRTKLLIESILNNTFQKRQAPTLLQDNDLNIIFSFRGEANVGTPAQSFNVLFDTGSFQFWIQSETCVNCTGSLFDSSRSSTFLDQKRTARPIRYVDGTMVNSQFISETVSVNNRSKQNLTMNLATSLNGDGGIDGIMGFGFSNKPDNPTFISEIFKSDSSLTPVFSYFLDSSDISGGLMIGGIDKSRFSGPLAVETILPLDKSPYWELPMNSLQIGGSKFDIPANMTAIFDTGSSLAVYSLSMAQRINEKLGMGTITEYPPGWYGVKCTDGKIPGGLPDLIMIFAGVKLKFTAKEYLYLAQNQNDIYCISGIFGIPKLRSDQSIIGNVLLRRYYTVFDHKNRKLGFATCNRQPQTQTNIAQSDLSTEIVGIADPKTVNGETNSRSNANRDHGSLLIHLLLFLLFKYI